ncbi:hypothetical protein [Streptomyces sp. GESEQ-35]|uniref:hypothetical protein n=1 Tax=Streptomyces sp. GESEQ-35 TaxID=2812657 RepID=UPI001B33C9DB|nr:hypothetical protein [Streptomyces sp. GESEQ-35]
MLLSEWTAGNTTYIWAVNNTLLDWEPSLVWRVGLRCGHRVPVMAKLKVALPALQQLVDLLTGERVSLLGGERVSLLGGEFTVDLRGGPAGPASAAVDVTAVGPDAAWACGPTPHSRTDDVFPPCDATRSRGSATALRRDLPC